MGLFSGGNSKTAVTNNTQEGVFSDLSDNAQAFQSSGDNNSIVFTDRGSVMAAFDFAKQVDSSAKDYASDLSATASDTVSESIKAVTESARTESENMFNNLQKLVFVGMGVWGVVAIAKSGIFKK